MEIITQMGLNQSGNNLKIGALAEPFFLQGAIQQIV